MEEPLKKIEQDMGADFDMVAHLEGEEQKRRDRDKDERGQILERKESGVHEGPEDGEEERRTEKRKRRAEQNQPGGEREEGFRPEAEWNENLVRKLFEPSQYILDRFEEAALVYSAANQIFVALRKSDKLNDEQMLMLTLAVDLESDAEETWKRATGMDDLEMSEFVESAREAWEADNLKKTGKMLEKRAAKLDRDMAPVRGESVVRFARDLEKKEAAGEISSEDHKRLKGVLDKAWFSHSEKALEGALAEGKISKQELRELQSVLAGMWPSPAVTMKEMTAMRPKIVQNKSKTEKGQARKAKRDLLAYDSNLERARGTEAAPGDNEILSGIEAFVRKLAEKAIEEDLPMEDFNRLKDVLIAALASRDPKDVLDDALIEEDTSRNISKEEYQELKALLAETPGKKKDLRKKIEES